MLAAVTVAAGLGFIGSPLHAQDLDPRRWSHLPTGISFFGIDPGRVSGDIVVDPVLKIEDADVER